MTLELCRVESCVPCRMTLYTYRGALQIRGNRSDGVRSPCIFPFSCVIILLQLGMGVEGGGESGMGGKWTKSREDPMTCHLS